MIDDISKIKKRTIKTLQEVARLKEMLQTQEKHYEFDIKTILLSIIEQIDVLEDQKKQKLIANKDAEEAFKIEGYYDLLLAPLKKILIDNNITTLHPAINTIPEFCKIVRTIEDQKGINGQIAEIIRPGYARGETIIRSTHVVVVQN